MKWRFSRLRDLSDGRTLTHRFEDNLQAWLNRPITTAWPYLFIDGMVVDVKEICLTQWCVLWASGMDEKRNIEVLGFVVLKTESQEGAERLGRDLKGRGLTPPQLIISDDSKAIENAAAMVFPTLLNKAVSFTKSKPRANISKMPTTTTPFYAKAKTKRAAIQRLRNFKKRWKKKESEAVHSLQAGFDKKTQNSYPI